MENKYAQLNNFAVRMFQMNGIPVPEQYEFQISKGIPRFQGYPSVLPKRYTDWAGCEVIRLSQETVLEALQGDKIDSELLAKASRILRAEADLQRNSTTN
jgi:hypothetical protein